MKFIHQLNNSPIHQLLVLVCVTVLVYANSFATGFALDNKALILEDARVHAATDENIGLILGRSYWWPVGESGLYRPLTTLSYLFNYAILGNEERPAGYHAVNLLLHVANVLLVYSVIIRLLGPAEAGHYVQTQKEAGRRAKAPTSPYVVSGFSRTPQGSGFSRTVAIGIAAVWAVHPLSTEAVTNIVGRADLLAAFGVLAGLLSYLRWREATGTWRVLWLLALGAATAIGVFSKESAVVVAAVVVLYEIVSGPAKAAHYVPKGVVSDIRRTTFSRTALAVIAVAIPLLLWWQQRSAVLGAAPAAELSFVDNPIAGAGFLRGGLTAVAVMGRYLRLLVWPGRLSADYSYAQIPLASGRPLEWLAWFAVAALAAIVGASCWPTLRGRAPSVLRPTDRYTDSGARRPDGKARGVRISGVFERRATQPAGMPRPEAVPRCRTQDTSAPASLVFFFGAFAFLSYLPASNLLFPTGTIMAERLMYLPSIGLIALFVLAVDAAARHVRAPSATVPLVLSAMFIVLAVRTLMRNPDWRDNLTLWTATVEAAPASFKAHRGLAEALYEADARGNLERAIAEMEKSVAILASLPDARNDARTHRQLASYYLEKGDAAAGDALQHRTPLPPASVDAYRKAIVMARRTAAILDASMPAQPHSAASADAQRLLSAAYLRAGDNAPAIDAATRARALEPSSVVGHRQLAAALLSAERHEDAGVALMTGTLLTNSPELRQQLMELYRQGLDPLGCAVAATRNGPALNPKCPTVRRHLCAATAEAIPLQTAAGNREDAERLRTSATELGCL